jgi:hypothetical protein
MICPAGSSAPRGACWVAWPAQGVLGVNVFKDVGAGVRKPPVRSRPGRITLAVVLLVLAAWIVLVQP